MIKEGSEPTGPLAEEDFEPLTEGEERLLASKSEPVCKEEYEKTRELFLRVRDVDIEDGKDFFREFVGEAKYIKKMQEFIDERGLIFVSESGKGTTKESRRQTEFQIGELERKLTHPAIARMIGMNTVWQQGIGAVHQSDNEETFRAITTILAFTGNLGEYDSEIEILRKNILRYYPKAKI